MPEDLDPRSLDREVREQLRQLGGLSEQVSLRLVAAGQALDDDPETSLAHALVARRLASRIAAVREAAGVAAYRAGQWQTAIGELRAYQRISGSNSYLAVLADCERAIGRPERAIDMYREAVEEQLAPEVAIELLIVAAGARADLGQHDAAVAMLQVPQLRSSEPWVARLRYAYADALLAVGRAEDARRWFANAAEVDDEALTDAAERLLELDGVVLDSDEVEGEELELGTAGADERSEPPEGGEQPEQHLDEADRGLEEGEGDLEDTALGGGDLGGGDLDNTESDEKEADFDEDEDPDEDFDEDEDPDEDEVFDEDEDPDEDEVFDEDESDDDEEKGNK